ncbi:MAG: hypothetical protein KF760_30925 [Candidatus Eremiobacteraeota bacterium]|nr:hypothetical protein [Candidatus Eremiobacteraeota bacterium]MCW5871244.1 hypothetical protein [Candidatus Eremiobacteraeota bacterium]
MKKNLSNLCLAGLIALAAVVATGCGSDDADFINNVPSTNLSEYVIIPNAGVAANVQGALVIKGVNTVDGTSSIVNNTFASANTANPVAVRSHPKINVFYALNQGTGQLTSYSVGSNGAIAELNSVACPVPAVAASNALVDSAYLIVHPAGGAVYAGIPGLLRQFNVASDGRLTASGFPDVNVGAGGWDGDFSHGGGQLHVPFGSAVRTYTVASTYQLTSPVDSALPAGSVVTDVDVRVGQASLFAAGAANADADGRIWSFSVADGVLSAAPTSVVSLTGSPLGTGDIHPNGQYYVGARNTNSVFAFTSDNETGTLTGIGTSLITGANAIFTQVDPLAAFVVSTQGTGNNNIDARSLDQNGIITGSTSDNQGLNVPKSFDFVQFINGGYVTRT